MSIKIKILQEVEKRPLSLRQLKEKLGNDRRVAGEVGALMSQGRLIKREGVLYLAAAPARKATRAARGAVIDPQKPPVGSLACTVVKLGRTFGFAQRQDGQGDIFLPGRSMRGAMPGDEVLIKLFAHPRVPGTQEGEVLAVTAPKEEFVGTVRRNEQGRLVFVPDVCSTLELPLKKSALAGAKEGDKAVARLIRGENHGAHQAAITLHFGSADQASQCVKALLYAQGVEETFPPEVRQEAAALKGAKVEPDQARGRMDLRALPIFTIDSASTKDIDDALSITENANGFELGVHIADVSHYVQPGTALDREALRRATSVYYADRVAPMLPKELSNGICSLNPGENRLAFSCLMLLDKTGKVQDYRFAKTLIHSRVKGVYSELNALYAGSEDEALRAKYAPVASQLPALKKLYDLRVAARRARGGMEIESGESQLILNEAGVCVDVRPHERGLTEAIIEECMLLANQCAANLARTRHLPFVYRVHEKPDAEHKERLFGVLKACGIEPAFAGETPTPKELSAILDSVRGQPLERAVHTGILRGMEKAKYDPQPKGHFGLALADYAHFTSPIRRYPDLAIHRILSAWLEGESPELLAKLYEDFAAQVSQQASSQEVKAQKVERGAEDCYKAEYMRGHLGEVFEGVISGVTAHGLYVELPNTVEGLVHASHLCQGQPVLVEGVRFADPLTGASWSMGDTMKVQVVKADVALGKVDFIPAP